MDEKELIGKTLMIVKADRQSFRDETAILRGTMQDRDGVLTLDLGHLGPPVTIQPAWLEKIEPINEHTLLNADFVVSVGDSSPHALDEDNSLVRWVVQKNKAKKAKRIRWMLSGAAICGAYALWRVLSGQAHIVSVVVQMLFGAWIGSFLVEKNWRERIGLPAVWFGAVALNSFYSWLLKHLWPSSPICCGTTNAKEYNYGLESTVLTVCTMLLFFFVPDWLSKRKK